MAEGVAFAHERGKKVFVTVNIIPHNEDFLQLEDYLLELEEIGKDADIITVERNEKMIEKAKENIKLAGFDNNITILEGDAEEKLSQVQGEFDLIFIDAAKGQYKLFFDLVIDKLKDGGLLVSDNILYKGMVAHDDFVVRRKKTIVKRMRKYLDYICNCDYLSTSLVPIGDGVALSYKESKRGDVDGIK
ncbi:O-methyltransferase, partial [Clostridioides difficile]|uniref:O-methyltransferase n=1 Tax=Clostridioides difficile TaxID=1496 RepID=UPI0029C5CAE3